MPSQLTISLKDLQFHAFHGLYPEERLTGNTFIVSVELNYQPPADSLIETIGDTVNYAAVYALVKARMQTPADLLETLAMLITEDIFSGFPVVTHIKTEIRKMHPPIPGFTGSVGVCYSKSR